MQESEVPFGTGNTSFPSEVSRHLTPLPCLPFHHRVLQHGMSAEPRFGAGDDSIELGGLRSACQLGLALPFLHPQDGVVGVAVDGLACDTLFVEQCQRVYDGQELHAKQAKLRNERGFIAR